MSKDCLIVSILPGAFAFVSIALLGMSSKATRVDWNQLGKCIAVPDCPLDWMGGNHCFNLIKDKLPQDLTGECAALVAKTKYCSSLYDGCSPQDLTGSCMGFRSIGHALFGKESCYTMPSLEELKWTAVATVALIAIAAPLAYVAMKCADKCNNKPHKA